MLVLSCRGSFAKHRSMQIPISKYFETEPECVFEIGFLYTTCNGKETSLSENKFVGKNHRFLEF